MELCEQAKKLVKVLEYYELVTPEILADRFKIVCPFHGDVNASLQINLEFGTYYCFGCGAKGGPKEFVQGIEKCNDLNAYIKLEQIIRSKSSNKFQYDIVETPKQSKSELRREAKRYFYSLPKPSWEYIKNSYMHKRGFTSKILHKIDARLNPNENYGIIMPIKDMGKFKGYVCRATNPIVESQRKYLYNKGFSRRNTLVGWYDKPWVVICEGYMDSLKLQQFGVHNSCAILGWKITNEQIEKLKEYTDCVISALDNTETGIQGTKILKQHFKVVRFKFPEAKVKDPGDLDIYDFRMCWKRTVDAVRKINPNIKLSNWR